MPETKEVKDEREVKLWEKPEGSLATVKVTELHNNPHRPDAVFVWNDEKIEGLIESYLVDGFQSTFEVTTDKWNNIFLAGGGHHRTEAIRRAIDRGKAGQIRGLFQDDDNNWCVKVVKKKYTKEQMLRNFMIENADAWGKDSQQNVCMMTMQIKDYLDNLLLASEDLEAFVATVKSPYPLQMDERAYTRAKNNGTGASIIQQYLGENTWSRPAIQMAVQLLYQEGEEGKKLREMAESLPSVTMAYKFKSLMTEEVEGEKMLSSAADQTKAEKLIKREALSRQDLEDADKIKKEKGISPLEALDALVTQKKEAKEAEKGDKKTTEAAPSAAAVKIPEAALEALKMARNQIRLLSVDKKESWSKAQFNQAKDLFKEVAADLKKIEKGSKK